MKKSKQGFFARRRHKIYKEQLQYFLSTLSDDDRDISALITRSMYRFTHQFKTRCDGCKDVFLSESITHSMGRNLCTKCYIDDALNKGVHTLDILKQPTEEEIKAQQDLIPEGQKRLQKMYKM